MITHLHVLERRLKASNRWGADKGNGEGVVGWLNVHRPDDQIGRGQVVSAPREIGEIVQVREEAGVVAGRGVPALSCGVQIVVEEPFAKVDGVAGDAHTISQLDRAAPRASNGVSTSAAKSSVFFFNDTATPEIYSLSLHDALP